MKLDDLEMKDSLGQGIGHTDTVFLERPRRGRKGLATLKELSTRSTGTGSGSASEWLQIAADLRNLRLFGQYIHCGKNFVEGLVVEVVGATLAKRAQSSDLTAKSCQVFRIPV